MSESMMNTSEPSLSKRSIENTIVDFIVALDEALATYGVLEKVEVDDSRPNQLLFCHIVNSFDSFICSLVNKVILSNEENLRDYFKKNESLEKNITMQEVIDMQDSGVVEWMKKRVSESLEKDLIRKRHAQKLDFLFDNISIDEKYVVLSTGQLKNNPTEECRKTLNHNTVSEDVIGYADILYEKRNAVTHNKNHYQEKTIIRLNQDWKLSIKRNSVIIKRDTIKAVFRFYTSICLELLKNKLFDNFIDSSKNKSFRDQLEGLNRLENVSRASSNDADCRLKKGGLKGRKEMLRESRMTQFTYDDYKKLTGVANATFSRDLVILIEEGIVSRSSQRGIYKIIKK